MRAARHGVAALGGTRVLVVAIDRSAAAAAAGGADIARTAGVVLAARAAVGNQHVRRTLGARAVAGFGHVTGADGRSYKVDTYVTWKQITSADATAGRLVKLVSIVVRDSASPYRAWARVSAAFDEGTGQ